jgi:hypothetical protein
VRRHPEYPRPPGWHAPSRFADHRHFRVRYLRSKNPHRATVSRSDQMRCVGEPRAARINGLMRRSSRARPRGFKVGEE